MMIVMMLLIMISTMSDKKELQRLSTEKKNAQIKGVKLGIEDPGSFTLTLALDYGGSGQCFGGHPLDGWSEKAEKRIGTAAGLEFIKQVLITVGVENVADIEGKYIRVEAEHCKTNTENNDVQET